ncbi:MAG: hypothetical protein Q9174_001884 [Haloplaca sp. 1 TL-2023]
MKRKREQGGADAAKPIKHARSKPTGENTGSPMNEAPSIDDAIGKMDSRLMADYVAQRSKRFGRDFSLIELADVHIPGKTYQGSGEGLRRCIIGLKRHDDTEAAILDTSEWSGGRRLHSLPDFLLYFLQRGKGPNSLESASSRPGEPHTLVVAAAALRAADLIRVLRQFQTKEATVAKLFAKHIKLKDATTFVKATRMNMGVGTPTRIVDLLDNGTSTGILLCFLLTLSAGALALESLQRIVVDCSFLDPKKRGIFDMRETQQPLMQLLNRPELKERYNSDSSAPVKLIFY